MSKHLSFAIIDVRVKMGCHYQTHIWWWGRQDQFISGADPLFENEPSMLHYRATKIISCKIKIHLFYHDGTKITVKYKENHEIIIEL